MRDDPGHARCADLAELLTDYLDDALPPEDKHRFDHHLESCSGCRTALSQWRTITRLGRRLTVTDIESLDPYVRDRLLTTVATPRRL